MRSRCTFRPTIRRTSCVRCRGSGGIASQSLLAGLEKVFRPAVMEVLNDPLAAAEFGDTVFAAQAFLHNANLVFCRKVRSLIYLNA